MNTISPETMIVAAVVFFACGIFSWIWRNSDMTEGTEVRLLRLAVWRSFESVCLIVSMLLSAYATAILVAQPSTESYFTSKTGDAFILVVAISLLPFLVRMSVVRTATLWKKASENAGGVEYGDLVKKVYKPTSNPAPAETESATTN